MDVLAVCMSPPTPSRRDQRNVVLETQTTYRPQSASLWEAVDPAREIRLICRWCVLVLDALLLGLLV